MSVHRREPPCSIGATAASSAGAWARTGRLADRDRAASLHRAGGGQRVEDEGAGRKHLVGTGGADCARAALLACSCSCRQGVGVDTAGFPHHLDPRPRAKKNEQTVQTAHSRSRRSHAGLGGRCRRLLRMVQVRAVL